jgi:primosomal protein N' (replication factor Y)
MKRFIDVILPLPIANRFTYELPAELHDEVAVGCRVIVPFGRKKYLTAIVVNLHDEQPATPYEIKEVMEVLDPHPVLLPTQLRFWEWIADYYLCTLGDVYKAALPSGMKLESESMVSLNPDFEAEAPFSAKEEAVWQLLSRDPEQCVTQLEKATGNKQILSTIQSLLEKGAITMQEEVRRAYKPKVEQRVRLAAEFTEEARLQALFDTLGRAPQQLSLLMKFLELSGHFGLGEPKEVSRKELLTRTGASAAILQGLIKKGVFELYTFEVGRLQGAATSTQASRPLSGAQQKAFDEIQATFQQKGVCLLHGVTSGGKTEIYIHLIEEVLKQGKQVLYLLPEIALTTQITERLRRVFGARLGIYHSKFPDAERVEIWQKQLSEQPYDLIIGVRSSIFLPFKDLGLVIVDEEHETSYKQQDPAPRYHARNAAMVLASLYGAKTLLGTATPSLESYHNAQQGKYGLVELTERYQKIQLPEIRVIDLQDLLKRRMMKMPFSPQLLAEIRSALERKEQVILFQNRRGFAPMIECKVCGWVPKCQNCDVSLTYHKGLNQMTCHYCGAVYPVPRSCPACNGVELLHRGFGTEKIEDQILQEFPEARVARMDLDTTRTRSAYERIIRDFQEGRTDILIGTQMVSKGLDFDHVSVVGILNADTMLNFPDFRAHERAFQLMAQVAGRAGRKNRRGLVLLQTKSPQVPVIRQVVENDYWALYVSQMQERSVFHYPPYFRLIAVYLKHRKEEVLNPAAEAMAQTLRNALGRRVLGPDKPAVSRVQTLFIKKILIKVAPEDSMKKVSEFLLQVQQRMLEEPQFRSIVIYYDVDPQ